MAVNAIRYGIRLLNTGMGGMAVGYGYDGPNYWIRVWGHGYWIRA